MTTIYHNPKCGTSRTVLAMLRDAGEVPTIIEYLKTPPTRDELVYLLRRMEIAPPPCYAAGAHPTTISASTVRSGPTIS